MKIKNTFLLYKFFYNENFSTKCDIVSPSRIICSAKTSSEIVGQEENIQKRKNHNRNDTIMDDTIYFNFSFICFDFHITIISHDLHRRIQVYDFRWQCRNKILHFFCLAQNLLKLFPMIGIGSAITSTPNIAQKQPRIFPKPVIGTTSPYPTFEMKLKI